VSQTTILLILVAIIVIAAIALFALRGSRGGAVAVAADTNDDPALSATGEAMIVGDVMPIDSNEPGMPPGTTEPPRPSKAVQVYEPRRPLQSTGREPDRTGREPDRTGREPERTLRDSTEPSQSADPTECQSELVEDSATEHAEIRWSKRFEPRDGAFDDTTRLNLIRDLGIVRAPWGVPLLTQAYEEEPAVEHRRAALRALAAYRHPDTQATFELALRADDEETRAIAANALTALSIRAALPS
jgi:hypothetical protein